MIKKNILIISNSKFISGAELSLLEYILASSNKCLKYFVATSNVDEKFYHLDNITTIKIPFIWFRNSFNPLILIKIVFNIGFCCWKLNKIIKEYNIDIIYSNSIKAHIYGSILKFITTKKTVWHVRDNINGGLLSKWLIKYSDKMICISDHIYQQVKVPEVKRILLYGGIDVAKWNIQNTNNNIRKSIGVPSDTFLVAQIGQLTGWKNYSDFIKANAIILKHINTVHFLIVGDDLSGNELKYKKQLMIEMSNLKLEDHIHFMGFQEDIANVYAQIDILIHPALDEPFGRVIIEAMAMTKPVLAYKCGGPQEIIVDGKTGYLVEPYDYHGLAEKTLFLINQKDLRMQFGTDGRRRVIERFNIERYVTELENVLTNV